MSRPLAFVALLVLLAGCTRYNARATGPFNRTPSPVSAIPPGPPVNNSPLVLASATLPEPPPPPDENRLVPGRPPEPAGLAHGFGPPPSSGVVQAGGIAPDANTAFPPLIRRRPPEPQPGQLPSPFAPKDGPMPKTPGTDTPPAPTAPPAPTPSPAAKNLAELQKVVRFAVEKWSKVDTYETVITRRELTPKGDMNSEVLLFQFRKEPMSLFTRNLGEAGKGREVVYNPGKHGDKLHVMLGEGDNRLMKAGFKAPPISPDDPRVKEKARYSIREAGFGTPIAKVADWVAKYEGGRIPADALTFLGPVNRPEYPYPLVGVSLRLRPGDDPMLPTGGSRLWFFDHKPDSQAFGLPVVMTAADAKGNEVEYYVFDKIRTPAGLTEVDFTPDRLGKKR